MVPSYHLKVSSTQNHGVSFFSCLAYGVWKTMAPHLHFIQKSALLKTREFHFFLFESWSLVLYLRVWVKSTNQGTTDCRLTLKGVCDMIRTQS